MGIVHYADQEDMDRLSWEDFFIGIAKAGTRRVSCPRARCCCVIVDPETHFVLAMGYNGAPPGEDHCFEHGCIMVDGHCQRAIHSEVNAIAYAAKHGVRIRGAHAYIYGQRKDGAIKEVCRECAKVLIAAEVTVMKVRGD